jgi:DNA-binding NarL/FixJ family response regulator
LLDELSSKQDSETLRKAVKVVYSGELWLDRKLIRDVLYNMSHVEKKVDLTRKEKEIVSLICNGYRNKEIAQKLDITEQTVKSHCNRIFKKVGVSDRLQLALYTHKIWPGHI